jgi:hypothetical protein
MTMENLRFGLGVLGAALLASLAASGCAPAGAVGLSQDGKRYAIAWPPGERPALATGSTAKRDLRMASDVQVAGAPVWSPDGAWIAVPTVAGVRLWDVRAARFRRDLGEATVGPVAWLHGGRQLAYMSLEDGVYWLEVLNLADRQTASRTAVGQTGPSQSAYAAPTESVALLIDRDVWLVERGEAARLTRTSDVVGIGVSADGRTVYWAREGRNMGFILMTLFGFDLGLRSVRRLDFPERIAGLNPRPRVGPESLRAIFSPGAHRLLLIGEGLGPRRDETKAVVVRRDGTQPRGLEQAPGQFDGAWSADGSTVAVLVVGPERARLKAFDANGSNGRELAVWAKAR